MRSSAWTLVTSTDSPRPIGGSWHHGADRVSRLPGSVVVGLKNLAEHLSTGIDIATDLLATKRAVRVVVWVRFADRPLTTRQNYGRRPSIWALFRMSAAAVTTRFLIEPKRSTLSVAHERS